MVEGEGKSTELLVDPGVAIQRDLSRLRLLVVDGPDAGRSCLLTAQAVLVGTDPTCQLTLSDGAVSRRHLLARLAAGGVWIQDQGSTNGTFCESSRVKEAVIGVGRSIRVGNTLLKIIPDERALRPAPAAEPRFHGMLGTSKRMREIFSTLAEVAPTDLSVLVEGETGTGKEALAEAIHRGSARAHKSLVVVDCTTIPRDLAESELFGHLRGAFTGAVDNREGSFEQAQGGTVFIDEVGDLPLELQPKLLRVLERRQVRPVGSARVIDVDVRVVAATNKDLKQEVAAGRFREDLYYRVAVVTVRLPPLRDRFEDLPQLFEHFLHQGAGSEPTSPRAPLDQASLSRFAGYDWPGNVRELRNVVERAVALHRTEAFDLEVFLAEVSRGLGESSLRARRPVSFKQAKSDMVDAFERSYLSDLMKRHGGNVSAAARDAGLDRHHFKDLLDKHGIKAK